MMRRKRTMYRRTLQKEEMADMAITLRDDDVTWSVPSDRIQFSIGPYHVTTASVRERFDLGKSQMQRFISYLLRLDWWS